MRLISSLLLKAIMILRPPIPGNQDDYSVTVPTVTQDAPTILSGRLREITSVAAQNLVTAPHASHQDLAQRNDDGWIRTVSDIGNGICTTSNFAALTGGPLGIKASTIGNVTVSITDLFAPRKPNPKPTQI